MRKMAKGAAITGGVFAVLFFLANILIFAVQIIMGTMLPVTFVITVLEMVTTLLLGIALFRCKADAFAAIVCLLNVPLNLYHGINSIISVNGMLDAERGLAALVYGLRSAAAWIEIGALILMAVQCFRKKGGKDMLCAVFAAIAAVLSVVVSLGISNIANWSVIDREGMAVLMLILPSVIVSAVNTLFRKIPLALGGLAIGNSKVEEPAAPYGQCGYQYQAQQPGQK